MTLSNSVFLLTWAAAIVAGVGLLGLLGTIPERMPPVTLFLDLAFWPHGLEGGGRAEARLLWGLFAGILTGWGVTLWLVAAWVLPRDPVQGRNIVLISVAVWYAVDGTGSALAGAPFNAILNLLFAGILLWPVVGIRR